MKTLFLATLIVAGIALAKSEIFGIDPATLLCLQFLRDSAIPCGQMLVSILAGYHKISFLHQ